MLVVPLGTTLPLTERHTPKIDFQSVDVVGWDSTIGNLLRFAGSQSKPFRFDVDAVGGTVLLSKRRVPRRNLSPISKAIATRFPAYVTWDNEVRNSCSHQRIVHYDFGGLKFFIRSQADGYVQDPDLDKPKVAAPTEPLGLGDALGMASLGSTVGDPDQQPEVKLQGTKIPQDLIFDMKTRARGRT